MKHLADFSARNFQLIFQDRFSNMLPRSILASRARLNFWRENAEKVKYNQWLVAISGGISNMLPTCFQHASKSFFKKCVALPPIPPFDLGRDHSLPRWPSGEVRPARKGDLSQEKPGRLYCASEKHFQHIIESRKSDGG
jgi:hypothetical protein